jgi:hypothetical protein
MNRKYSVIDFDSRSAVPLLIRESSLSKREIAKRFGKGREICEMVIPADGGKIEYFIHKT